MNLLWHRLGIVVTAPFIYVFLILSNIVVLVSCGLLIGLVQIWTDSRYSTRKFKEIVIECWNGETWF